MNGRARLLIVCGLVAAPAPASAQLLYNGGAPNGGAGFDIFNDFRSADDFELTMGGTLDAIRFWGLLPTMAFVSPTIFWEVLTDQGGMPGTVVAGGSAVATSTFRTSLGNGFDSWQFDVLAGGYFLNPGVYWLALHDGLPGDITDSSLIWETTAGGRGGDFAVEFLPTAEWTPGWTGNLAFELSGQVVPEPASLILLGTGLLGLAGASRRRTLRSTLLVCAAGSRRILNSVLRIVGAVAVLAATGGAVAAQAQPVPMSFCYVPLTGTVYRVGTPDTRPACASAAHVPFTVTDGAGALRNGSAAGGDLANSYPNPAVGGLQGRPVAPSAPAVGQTLTWNGSAWAPATPQGVLGGDPARPYRVEAAGLLVNAGGVMAFSIPSYGGPSVTRTGVGEYLVSFASYQVPIQPFFQYVVKATPWSGHAPFPANGHPNVSVLNLLANGFTLRVTDAQGAPMDLGIGRGFFIEVTRIN